MQIFYSFLKIYFVKCLSKPSFRYVISIKFEDYNGMKILSFIVVSDR